MKSWWKFLAAWWSDDPTEANYPAVPGGQVPTLQADGTVQWSDATVASGHYEPLVDGSDPDNPELVFDAVGDVIMVWVED